MSMFSRVQNSITNTPTMLICNVEASQRTLYLRLVLMIQLLFWVGLLLLVWMAASSVF
jgi:hypothetical protein